MESVSVLEFRRQAETIIRKVLKGKHFILTFRGKPVMPLEPIVNQEVGAEDPFYSLDQLAEDVAAASPMKKSTRSSTKSDVIFVDTSGFYALLVKGDPMHARATSVLARAAQASGRFVTSDYVLDETATLLKARGLGHVVDAFFSRVFESAACRIEWMDADRFQETRRFFLKHRDQDWSFTDCFSFRVMRSLGIREALTTDDHYRQAGFHPLLR